MNRRGLLYALVMTAAAARLLLQMAALPPYAGLDEVYHVARLAFVRAQGRNPTIFEWSVPPYLFASMAGRSDFSAAFCVVGPKWPEVVHSQAVIVDRPLQARVLKPYLMPNYEAQQPSLYYSLFARLAPLRTPMFELRVWRFLSVLFALIIVAATAFIGERWFGPAGILAGALVVSLPTWLTLVVRASNDAFACALLAIAVVVSASAPRSPYGEAIAWAAALAAKLYTWPVALVLPLFWRQQRAHRDRVSLVMIACALSAALTISDLSTRTRNPLGLFAFDTAAGHAAAIRYGEMLKIWIATLAWTSGQHWDALTPLAIALYLGPILALVVIAQSPSSAASRHLLPASGAKPLVSAAIISFAIAQVINAAAYARGASTGLPAGGKEGWYWYALVPILVPALLAPALKRWRAITFWIVAWDILITEVALFHDFSGASSPAHPTLFFRWGPWHLPFTAHLEGIAVGPLVGALVMLRIIHVAALFALESFSRAHDRPNHLALPSH